MFGKEVFYFCFNFVKPIKKVGLCKVMREEKYNNIIVSYFCIKFIMEYYTKFTVVTL